MLPKFENTRDAVEFQKLMELALQCRLPEEKRTRFLFLALIGYGCEPPPPENEQHIAAAAQKFINEQKRRAGVIIGTEDGSASTSEAIGLLERAFEIEHALELTLGVAKEQKIHLVSSALLKAGFGDVKMFGYGQQAELARLRAAEGLCDTPDNDPRSAMVIEALGKASLTITEYLKLANKPENWLNA